MDKSKTGAGKMPEAKKPDIFFREEFRLIIRDRQMVLFEGNAAAISTRNEGGLLDILPEHTNFISIVKEFIQLDKIDGSVQKFDIDTGIIKVLKNDVRVYLGVFSGTNSSGK